MEDDLKTPVEGLVSRVDYRGVNPAVWFLYLEMYGKDSAQDLCRRAAGGDDIGIWCFSAYLRRVDVLTRSKNNIYQAFV